MGRQHRGKLCGSTGNAPGINLLQLCLELGYLGSHEEQAAVSGVCRTLNVSIRAQVEGLTLPLSALLQLQQHLAWRNRVHASTLPAAAAEDSQQQRQQQREHASAIRTTRRAAAAAAAAEHGSIVASSGSRPLTCLQEYIGSRLPKLGRLRLVYNSIAMPQALGSQLQQLALLTQLTSFDFRDSCSWWLPCSGLSSLSCLTQLQQLVLLVQSPGMPAAAGPGGLPFPPVASCWQAGVSQALSSLTALTQLKHLQLRFICGERGYFMCPTLLTVAGSLEQLSHLDLGYVEVAPAGLAAVAQLQQLQCLTLYGSLSGLAAQDYCCLSSLRCLRRLEMFHDWPPASDDVAEPDAHALDEQELQQLGAALGCLAQLSWLNLPMSHASTALLPLLHKLPALTQLYLQSIERHQMEVPIAALEAAAQQLKVLQVDNVRLTSQGLASIAGLTQLRQLTLFNLRLDVDLVRLEFCCELACELCWLHRWSEQ
ncbi:hypothetical protein COO60DRAFT_257963 [Scenedesmus sp. NREL 46B-D3]|nr:hypothetical protein COO60DRAFT_257963 [Scenedesmus sp. NREL 46B-D3]